MVKILKLKNPLLIEGKEIKEFKYDEDEITNALLVEAYAEAKKGAGAGFIAGVTEVDYVAHLYVGMAAVIALNPYVDFNDFRKMKGRDNIKLQMIGRGFLLVSEESEHEILDEPSETIQKPSIPQLEISTTKK